MKFVSAREANQAFSRVLGEAECGEDLIITRHGNPVAILRSHRSAADSADRQAAVEHAIRLMDNAPSLGTTRRFSRDEMHER